MAAVSGATQASSGSTHPYFVDTKKGEVSELKTLLKNISVEKDPKRKRDVIKKVIAYMTLGIDVSRLFTEMVMAIETRDLVVKKMVYLYLCNYAHDKPDLAIMCVNTLQRDCSSDDPMVRGLALRSLCSLRLPSMVEYISEPLRRALTDPSAYVRKTGVMGILKLYHLAPDMVKGSNMIDLLYNMIQDPDSQVIMNCILVLSEVLADEGGMGVNQALALHVLSKATDFNEWGLVQVLSLVSRYDPVNEDETISLLNHLDPILRTTNSGVVLAAVKCFIHLTKHMADLQPQVYMRVKAPLLTLMGGGNPEVEYCILKHLGAMIHRCPGVFDDEYRQFYVRYTEPSFVKYEKIGILALLASEQTANDITTELAEYASDVDTEVSRRSIRSIGRVAFRLPSAAPYILEKLLEFLELDMNDVRPEAVLVLKDLLRKYPDRRADVLPSLPRVFKRIDEPEARAAIVWMLGEYGEELPSAPYLLEPLVDGYADVQSHVVKMDLLTAIMKLFFKRPPEVQGMLGRLLSSAVNDFSSQDLHDRALLYYRLLSADVNVAKRVVLGPPERQGSKQLVSSAFAEDRDAAGQRERLYAEFNTLAILYDKPSVQFVSPGYQFKVVESSIPPRPSSADAHHLPDDRLLSGPDDEGPPTAMGRTGYAGPSMDLLDMGPIGSALPPAPGPPAPPLAPPGLALVEGVTMEPPAFQSLWASLPDPGSFNVQLQRLPSSTAELEAGLARLRIATLASGDLPDSFKFFLYAQDLDGDMYLTQALIHKATKRMEVTVKTEASPTPTNDPVEAFVEVISTAMTALNML